MKRATANEVLTGMLMAAVATLMFVGGCGGTVAGGDDPVAQVSCAADQVRTCSEVAGELACGCTAGGRQATSNRQGDPYWTNSCIYQPYGRCKSARMLVRPRNCILHRTSYDFVYRTCSSTVVAIQCCELRGEEPDAQGLLGDWAHCTSDSQCAAHRCGCRTSNERNVCLPMSYPSCS